MWQDRIRILTKPPWIFAPLNLVAADQGTTWAEAMTARPVMGTDGFLTIALGEGDKYHVLPLLTGFFGIIGGIRQRCRPLWRQTTISRSWHQPVKPSTTRPADHAGLINRMIIDMPKDGKRVRQLRIDHKVGDTPAKQKWLRPDKRQSEEQGPVSDKRQKDDATRSRRQWDDRPWWQSSDWASSSSSSWRWQD